MPVTISRELHERLRAGRFDFSATGTSPGWWLKSAAYWRNQCRRHTIGYGQVKLAELGGGQDTPFEQAFSNLAHAYLKDKAPKLLEYEIGFQLLEKNQENTKSVGVFGFKVGSQWIYCPVFFLNGDLKGHELMYIKSQDMFLPLKEEWIDYILGKKPAVLGSGVNRNLSLLGIMPPNLYQINRSPQKFASDQSVGTEQRVHTESDEAQSGEGTTVERFAHREPEKSPTRGEGTSVYRTTHTEPDAPKMATWARDFMPNLAYLATTPVSYEGVRGVPDLLKEAGEPLFRFLVEKVGTTYPVLFQQIDALYGPEMLNDVARDIYQQKQAAASQSIVKSAAVVAAGEKLPADWDGTFQEPSKVNGGVRSNGKEAVAKAQVGRRRSDAWVGQVEDTPGYYKGANYPGCGMHRRRGPKGPKGRRMRKRGSVIPSLIGPMEAMPEGIKHRVISREMVDLDPQIVHDMSADERATLLKERVVYRDKREKRDVTIAYNVQTPLKLQNPDRTTIYYVLVKPDKFEKCLVVMHPYNHKQQLGLCTVVRLEGKKAYVNTHPANVWVRGEVDNDAWKKWLNDLKTCESIPLQRKGKDGFRDWKDKRVYMLLGPSGEGTCPFRAREEYTGGKDESINYDVCFEDHEYSHRPAYLPDHGRGMRDPYMTFGDSDMGVGEHLVLTKRPGTKITVRPGYCLVPDQFKIFQASDEDGSEETRAEPLQTGTLLDAQLLIMANTEPLKVMSDGKDMEVNENRMDKKSAVMHLFYDHGLTKEAAEEIVARAEKSGRVEVGLVYSDYIKACWDMTDQGLMPAEGAQGGRGGAKVTGRLSDIEDAAKLILDQTPSSASEDARFGKWLPGGHERHEDLEAARLRHAQETMKGVPAEAHRHPSADVPYHFPTAYLAPNELDDLGEPLLGLPDDLRSQASADPALLAKLKTHGALLHHPSLQEGPGGWAAKQAADPGNDMIRGAPNAPPFPEPYMGYDPLTGGNVPTMQQSEFNMKIPDMSASKTDRTIYYPFGPDPKAMQVAQDASRTGQKEVFDTAMLGSLLKVLRQDNMVDRYMGDLMKGVDRLGRILFLYYWHGDEFEDRYGKQDMPELEDGLRNAFEGVGDIVLALKRKAIEPQMGDDNGGGVDLGPIANQ